MMKAKGFLTEKIADLNDLYVAFAKASRGKQNKKSVLLFRNLEVDRVDAHACKQTIIQNVSNIDIRNRPGSMSGNQ